MAAPTHNTNAVRHGLSAAVLPKRLKHVETRTRTFRRHLEEATAASHGSIGVTHAALIQSAVRHERRASLAENWLRTKYDTLKLEERLALLKTASDATDSRDRCIERLRLDSGENPMAALYREGA